MLPPLSDDHDEAAELSGYEPTLAKFLHSFHSDDLRRILLHSEPTLHFPLIIDFAELFDFDTELGNALYNDPKAFLPVFDAAAQRAQSEVLEILNTSELMGTPDKLNPAAAKKEFVHVRVNTSGSPLLFPESSPSIGKVRVKHRGVLLTLKGTVIRSGGVKMIEGERW